MAYLRVLVASLFAGCLLALAACSNPPPPRVTTRAVYKVNTALLLASADGQLTAEQLQAKRDEVVRYLTERGLLAPDDVLVSNPAAADRIIRVSIAASGGFKVTIFNPGSTGAYYSAGLESTHVGPSRLGASDYWPSYDPWFDEGYYYSPYPAPGYYRYQPRDPLRPHYPRDYQPPVEPRRTPPPSVVSDPTPTHPRDHDRNHDGRADKPHRDHASDWRDRTPSNRPDHHDRNGTGPDFHPRPTPPPPAITPPEPRRAPEPRHHPEPRYTPEPRKTPEPRESSDNPRDDDRHNGPLPPK